MVTAFVRSVLAEPRVADPPAWGWRDLALVCALLISAVAESIFRPDVPWRPLATVVALLVIPVLLWRRTHPLLATVIGFGGALALHLPTIFADVSEVGLNSMIGIIVLDHGGIIEEGTHDALLEKGGTYAELYNTYFRQSFASSARCGPCRRRFAW